MGKTKDQIINNYWEIMSKLNTPMKLDLIERLSRSIRENIGKEKDDFQKAFGAWKSDESAEDIIKEIRNSRYTNRQIEEL